MTGFLLNEEIFSVEKRFRWICICFKIRKQNSRKFQCNLTIFLQDYSSLKTLKAFVWSQITKIGFILTLYKVPPRRWNLGYFYVKNIFFRCLFSWKGLKSLKFCVFYTNIKMELNIWFHFKFPWIHELCFNYNYL